jgi:hypothetical protein
VTHFKVRESLEDQTGEGAAASFAFCPKLQCLDLREQALDWQGPGDLMALPILYRARLTDLGRGSKLRFVSASLAVCVCVSLLLVSAQQCCHGLFSFQAEPPVLLICRCRWFHS